VQVDQTHIEARSPRHGETLSEGALRQHLNHQHGVGMSAIAGKSRSDLDTFHAESHRRQAPFAARVEAALDWLQARYVERGNFLSDDDVLDAAEEFTSDRNIGYLPENREDYSRLVDTLFAQVFPPTVTVTLTEEQAKVLMHAVGYSIASLSARRAPGDKDVQTEIEHVEAILHAQGLK
jgi:hypothetical protein